MEKLCAEVILSYDTHSSVVLDVRDNREGVKRWRKKRQAQAVRQEKCCLQHYHSDKRCVTEIEIQGGERRGESFPAWVDVKSHIVEIIIWRNSQTDLQCGCCVLGRSLSQVSLKFAGLDINKWAGWWLPRAWPHGAGGITVLNISLHSRSSSGQRDPLRDVSIGLVSQIKISRNRFSCWIFSHYS